ncbi:hypothetical protein BDR07DRAFT_779873 [Suillus spraguei]|nr:hypothetical protein BDR07DRAFT_779873 [Suillus spraguei]
MLAVTDSGRTSLGSFRVHLRHVLEPLSLVNTPAPIRHKMRHASRQMQNTHVCLIVSTCVVLFQWRLFPSTHIDRLAQIGRFKLSFKQPISLVCLYLGCLNLKSCQYNKLDQDDTCIKYFSFHRLPCSSDYQI